MIVAGDNQYAAVLGCASRVGVAEYVAAAVNPRTLPIPERKDAVVFGAREEAKLLATPNGGGGKVFVDAWLKNDVVLVKMRFGAPQVEVDPAQRAAAVT